MAEIFQPDYLNIDFNTVVQKIKDGLSNSDRFRDYDYEGSNIAVLIELVAYITELSTFYTNRIAKNIYLETADQYENVNRISRQQGYEPRGYRSARATINIVISGATPGDKLIIDPWTRLDTGQKSVDGNNAIFFSTTTTTSGIVSASGRLSLTIQVRQGIPVTLSGYKGSDLVDNQLSLPADYAYDDDIDDDYPVMGLTVNDDPWSRVSDFYDNLSALYDEDDVYMLIYNKYQSYKILFNSTRNVPISTDEIDIVMIQSLGAGGSIGANLGTWLPPTNFIYRESDAQYLHVDDGYTTMTITNPSASTGGEDPETIDQIKESSKAQMHAQYRNVTKKDYSSYLETRDDVVQATAWGEQEVNPSGSVLEYNKVHLSVIPNQWNANTITTSAGIWTTSNTATGSIYKPVSYSNNYTSGESGLSVYLELRKMLTVYEIFELPELIWFSFDIGLKLKRLYSFVNASNDVLNKLNYYFSSQFRDFNEEIDFYDIINYLLDTTEVSPTDNYTYIKGIKNLIIRDVSLINANIWDESIYEEMSSGQTYPYYTTSAYSAYVENQIRTIKLGYYQFPMLSANNCQFTNET